MAHHAYFVAGERNRAISAARAFVQQTFVGTEGVPDIAYFNFELLSVDDARRLIDTASLSGVHGQKAIIVSMTRFFHEAQNALLKILEEPPAGLVIILCVPSEGIFIPTLRSRLLPHPSITLSEGEPVAHAEESIAERFFAASSTEREKLVAKLVEQSKADKDETKQKARREALELLQGLTEAAYVQLHEGKTSQAKEEARRLLADLASFMPILYERSAPLKLIFEHLLLVIPKSLRLTKV